MEWSSLGRCLAGTKNGWVLGGEIVTKFITRRSTGSARKGARLPVNSMLDKRYLINDARD